MALLSRLSSLWRNLFTRRRVERDLDDELRTYLDQLTEEKRAAGGARRKRDGQPGSSWAVWSKSRKKSEK